MSAHEVQFALASESELNELAVGHHAGISTPWPTFGSPPRLYGGTVGVLYESVGPTDAIRPLAIVAGEQDHPRLCARFAQLRSDLSPLTAWCHLLTPRHFERLESIERRPELNGFVAAWTGLIIAEAVLLSNRPISKVKLASCLATQTFAVARTKGLWGRISLDDILQKFDASQRILRSADTQITRLRSAFRVIWETLIAVSVERSEIVDASIRPFVYAVKDLARAREFQSNGSSHEVWDSLADLAPEAYRLNDLGELTPEKRLEQYDLLIRMLSDSSTKSDSARKTAYAILAGYLATVAAGGAASLALTEATASIHPEVTGWAYALGGVGEKVVWSSGFDGLGRLVARELQRSFRLDDAPTCDFSIDEANVLVDPKLSDPLVHLRIKQARLVTVSLFPGVNITVPISESTATDQRRASSSEQYGTERGSSRSSDPTATLVDMLLPQIISRIENMLPRLVDAEVRRSKSPKQSGRGKKGGQLL